MTAATVVLPHEEAAALEERVAAWKGDLRPAGAVEAYFVEQAAHASWQLDRANRTIAAQLTERMQQGPTDRDDPDREADEVEALARDLFWDPRGPVAVYPHPRTALVNPRISWPSDRDDPLYPAPIVRRLEALPTGCRWLLDRWAELRKILDDGRQWQAPTASAPSGCSAASRWTPWTTSG